MLDCSYFTLTTSSFNSFITLLKLRIVSFVACKAIYQHVAAWLARHIQVTQFQQVAQCLAFCVQVWLCKTDSRLLRELRKSEDSLKWHYLLIANAFSEHNNDLQAITMSTGWLYSSIYAIANCWSITLPTLGPRILGSPGPQVLGSVFIVSLKNAFEPLV